MEHVSLSEVHQSVEVPERKAGVGIFRRLLVFGGPAYLVSVGYMDPGNWATDLEGGARFGYSLIWVLLLSNLMALLLQTLSARLGIVTGRDLAQSCGDEYPKPVTIALWLLCEIAIIACDLAEVLGTAIALQLLFGLPLVWGVSITAFDAVVLLALQRFGVRKLEASIITLVLIVGACFLIEIILAKPDLGGILSGAVPSLPDGSLVIAIGIIGATVMPHNLYLHSALVQTRRFAQTPEGKREACKFNFYDTLIALNGALFINGAILVLSAAVFFSKAIQVTEIQQAHQLLSPLLGTTFAGILFAVALLSSGQSSTVTGTLAGQIVMEGFVHIRIRPVVRRVITRAIAIIPAVLVISLMGEASSLNLLITSQVVLSLQLSFAVIPLIHFTSSKRLMGEFVNKLWVKIASWITACIVLSLNIKYLLEKEQEILSDPHSSLYAFGLIAIPFLIATALLLGYIIIEPFLRRVRESRREASIPVIGINSVDIANKKYDAVGVALEGNEMDERLLAQGMSLCSDKASLVLIHVIGSPMTMVSQENTNDSTARAGEAYMNELKKKFENDNRFRVQTILGYGSPPDELVRIAGEEHLELLVMGSHGHRGLKDIIFGATITPVRHKLSIPVFIVQ
jgi:manganese transport protein